jgi:hypothetical protein
MVCVTADGPKTHHPVRRRSDTIMGRALQASVMAYRLTTGEEAAHEKQQDT